MRPIRIAIASIVFLILSFYFVDFAGFLPDQCAWLAKIQLIPALKSHQLAVLLAIIAVTMLMGRLYCSVICPLGVLQDFISWTAQRIHRKRRFTFKPALRWIRPIFLIALIAGTPIGIMAWLDPYSIFGRIAVNVFKPVYQTANNAMVYVCSLCGIYQFGTWPMYYVNAMVQTLLAAAAAMGFLLIIGFLAYRNGRTYCNTICPVGTFLGFIARIAPARVRIDQSKCISCGLCAGKCKSSCIDSKSKTIDISRCVDCFDCLSACKKDAIHFSVFPSKSPTPDESSPTSSNSDESKSAAESALMKSALTVASVQGPDSVQGATSVQGSNSESELDSESKTDSSQPDNSRRQFMETLLTITTLTPAGAALGSAQIALAEQVDSSKGDDPEMFKTGNIPFERKVPIAPPGAMSIGHLNHHCTSCHLCVSKCPAHVLKPAVGQYGLQGFLQPYMEFSRGFCNYDCTICGDVCPNGAIRPLTIEQKHKTQMGRVVFIEDNCVVKVKENSCGACSEHCPTQAVSMVPYKNGLTIPHINPDICVGCGGCESICPVRPFRAIYVEGNEKQHDRADFVEPPQEELKLDGFGF